MFLVIEDVVFSLVGEVSSRAGGVDECCDGVIGERVGLTGFFDGGKRVVGGKYFLGHCVL